MFSFEFVLFKGITVIAKENIEGITVITNENTDGKLSVYIFVMLHACITECYNLLATAANPMFSRINYRGSFGGG